MTILGVPGANAVSRECFSPILQKNHTGIIKITKSQAYNANVIVISISSIYEESRLQHDPEDDHYA